MHCINYLMFYLQQMDTLLGEKPFMAPVTIASSSERKRIIEYSSSSSDSEVLASTPSREYLIQHRHL